MTTRYQKSQIEDVARILRKYLGVLYGGKVAGAFADLFAAAPELLEALEGLVADDVSYNCAYCSRNASDHDPHRDSCPVISARAAIKAARQD